MRILIANVKLFFQRRMFWCDCLWLAVTGFGAWSLIHTSSSPDTSRRSAIPVGVVLLMLVLGSMVGFVRRYLASRVISFLLPGWQSFWRWFILLIGLVSTSVASLVCFAYMDTNTLASGPLASAFLAVLSANLISYWVGVYFAVSSSDGTVAMGPILVGGVFPLVGYGATCHSDAFVAATRTIIDAPSHAIMAATVTTVLAWRWLGRRRYHRPTRAPIERDVSSSWIDRFFWSRAYRCQAMSHARYVWGVLHILALPGNPWRRGVGIFIFFNLAFVVTATYFLPLGICFEVVPLVVTMIFSYDALLDRRRVLTTGRQERFLSAMTVLWAAAAILILSVAVPSILLDLLQPVLAHVEITNQVLHYTPVSLWVIVVLGALLPLAFLADIAFLYVPDMLILTKGFLMVVGGIVLYNVHLWMMPVPFLVVVLLTGLPWMFCAVVVRYVALHTDLIQDPKRLWEV